MLSWVSLKGRCRYCGRAVACRYIVVEICGGAAGGLLAWRWGVSPALFLSMVAFFGLLLNALTDLDDGHVFDLFPLTMGLCGLAARLIPGWGGVLDGLLGGTAGFGVIALIILVSRGGMGWGDATLAAGTGAILGLKLSLLTLYLGFMAGGFYSIALMALGKLQRKDTLPLVPFLAFGGAMTLLFGPRLLSAIGFDPGPPWR